jgi:hypothetical protein
MDYNIEFVFLICPGKREESNPEYKNIFNLFGYCLSCSKNIALKFE